MHGRERLDPARPEAVPDLPRVLPESQPPACQPLKHSRLRLGCGCLRLRESNLENTRPLSGTAWRGAEGRMMAVCLGGPFTRSLPPPTHSTAVPCVRACVRVAVCACVGTYACAHVRVLCGHGGQQSGVQHSSASCHQRPVWGPGRAWMVSPGPRLLGHGPLCACFPCLAGIRFPRGSCAVPCWPGQLSVQGSAIHVLREAGSVLDLGTLAPASLPSLLSLWLNVSGAEE